MKKNVKKKTTNSKKSILNLKYIIYFLLLVIFSVSTFIVGIVYSQKNYEKELKKTQNSVKILQEKIKKLKTLKTPSLKHEKETHPLKYEKETTQTDIPSEIVDYEKSQNESVTFPPILLQPEKKTPIISVSKKPKLVIIIDDVSFNIHIKKIKAIPYKITPSFFPPSHRHPNTALYAEKFSHYMIHLPMQAVHFHKPEPKTLNITDNYQTILNRIIEVKKLFPKAKFINNHTGSTFTANTSAMIKLFKALKVEHIGFVDSKTTVNTKAKEAQKIYNIPLYSRNIFLDNKANPAYIKKQLKKAVQIAKKRGFAIAIGHPHSTTLETLKNAKNILKDVDVVYIDELK